MLDEDICERWISCNLAAQGTKLVSPHAVLDNRHRSSSGTGDARAVQAALRGVRAVICTGRLGEVLPLCQQRKVEHLILLTSTGEAPAVPLQPALISGHNRLGLVCWSACSQMTLR